MKNTSHYRALASLYRQQAAYSPRKNGTCSVRPNGGNISPHKNWLLTSKNATSLIK